LKKQNKAFTIIELIVVMAIIGVLVLLAMPKFMGYTQRAHLTEIKSNIKQIENASERYYMTNQDWPRLSDTPYTSAQVETFAQEIKDKTGQIVPLETDGKYYEISYDNLQEYVQKPKDGIHYILQNPVGEVFYLDKLTQLGENALEQTETVVNNEPLPIQAVVPAGWIGIYTLDDLNNMRNNLIGKYILMNNLDFKDDNDYANISNKTIWETGLGWNSVGIYNTTSKFEGIFDGNGLKIDNLYIKRPNRYLGLFGSTGTATIKNLTMTNAYVSSTDIDSSDGILIGYALGTTISNIKTTGQVVGTSDRQSEGGIVGNLSKTSVMNQCVSGANVSGPNNLAGSLVGYLSDYSTINNSYAYGNVTSTTNAGGLVGAINRGYVNYSYSIGNTTGAGKGGLSSYTFMGSTASSYWDKELSGILTSASGTGKTTVQMKQRSTYSGWDFTNIWVIDESKDYPRLIWESK